MDDNLNDYQPYQQKQFQQSKPLQQDSQAKSKPEESRKLDAKLYSTSKIEDFKQEKIAFVVDMYEEIALDDFVSLSGDKKLTRFDAITDEILNFVKLKDYFSPKTEFALYTYSSTLKKEIKFCIVNTFISRLNSFRMAREKEQLAAGEACLDLSFIYKEAMSYLQNSLSIASFGDSKNSENNTIIRFILFYNRSTISAISSNKTDYNVFTFLRLANFIFDVVFLRRKIGNEDEKKAMSLTYSSFLNQKAPSWYLFDNAGNLHQLKYIMNLLLANPNQRVKYSNTEKYQKKIDDLIRQFSDN